MADWFRATAFSGPLSVGSHSAPTASGGLQEGPGFPEAKAVIEPFQIEKCCFANRGRTVGADFSPRPLSVEAVLSGLKTTKPHFGPNTMVRGVGGDGGALNKPVWAGIVPAEPYQEGGEEPPSANESMSVFDSATKEI